MGNAGRNVGSPQYRLNWFLNKGEYHKALPAAFEVDQVRLEDALRLTMLAASNDRDRFERMAWRFVVRLVDERKLTDGLLRYVIADLYALRDRKPFEWEEAERRLQQVAEKLARSIGEA
jgi:hypothetical protein